MNDTTEAKPQGAPWLLLIHRLPPEPAYLRVKVRRRLQRLGALLLKNSVYVLPNHEDALEDFQWLAREIEGEGGTAIVCEATFIDGSNDEAVMKAETTRGRTWVTRTGVKVDRIASAWLIRRFIDPDATFAFVAAREYVPRAEELRFDMFGGEFTHEGERCTFETLLARFALATPALTTIGEIIHDIDCKDGKYERPETGGIARLIDGIVASHKDDDARLARGAAMFDDLHATLAKS